MGILLTEDAVAVGRLVRTGCGSISCTLFIKQAFVVAVYCPLRRWECRCRGCEDGQGEGQRKGKGNDEVHG